MTSRRPRIFTIGHSNRDLDDFFRLLEKSSIRIVADVRSNPSSSRFPHFERHALSSALARRGLSYRWFRVLGGRAPESRFENRHTALPSKEQRRYAAFMNTVELTDAAAELIGLATSAVVSILCAERDFTQCHRRLLSDKLEVMGARVVHILGDDSAVEHTLHSDLRVEGEELIYESRQLELL